MNLLKKIITNRKTIQIAFAIAIYAAVSILKWDILYVFGGAIILGVIFGKVFCRWMCPIGLFMEFMLKGKTKEDHMMHTMMYHKMGCPIAWITGFLNKFSLFKIVKDSDSCVNCGKCDKVCYIATMDSNFSVYKDDKKDAGKSFRCSKCLECVTECPVNSLTYKPSIKGSDRNVDKM